MNKPKNILTLNEVTKMFDKLLIKLPEERVIVVSPTLHKNKRFMKLAKTMAKVIKDAKVNSNIN